MTHETGVTTFGPERRARLVRHNGLLVGVALTSPDLPLPWTFHALAYGATTFRHLSRQRFSTRQDLLDAVTRAAPAPDDSSCPDCENWVVDCECCPPDPSRPMDE